MGGPKSRCRHTSCAAPRTCWVRSPSTTMAKLSTSRYVAGLPTRPSSPKRGWSSCSTTSSAPTATRAPRLRRRRRGDDWPVGSSGSLRPTWTIVDSRTTAGSGSPDSAPLRGTGGPSTDCDAGRHHLTDEPPDSGTRGTRDDAQALLAASHPGADLHVGCSDSGEPPNRSGVPHGRRSVIGRRTGATRDMGTGSAHSRGLPNTTTAATT